MSKCRLEIWELWATVDINDENLGVPYQEKRKGFIIYTC